ncbi:toll/interleukin-1 receptor domain-containing protein [Actinomycetospora callitridis]|uniref:toll/interleukin-1 receptor domain-containing protein n=1 Tax=Actinomycetospora callitridis TaxID=913944 RepID=UPI002366E4D1|nr:toll/interleukin-1 receptor domain-containing protein [Actinomycetospora callitridis]MDD7921245.1 toll/interleukin-1 receptor domain-containing protein [Actinomycetospora callitridis]
MPKGFTSGEFNRKMRAAQRKAQHDAEAAAKRAQRKAQHDAEASAKRSNRDLERRVTKAIKDGNRDAERRARRLQDRAARGEVSPPEQDLLHDFQKSLAEQSSQENDLFLSYTRSDGWQVAGSLYEGLRAHGVTVWFDERAMRLGQSQALQMDRGLTTARGGVVLLTPAYLEGRFWPERELATLLHKPTVVPVLHEVTFGQVAAYSAILGDLHGLSTEHHTPSEIAALISEAVLDEDAA